MADDSGDSFELARVSCKCIGAYVRNKKNQNQICWIWHKVKSEDDKGFQRFLDNVQYKCSGILLYERVFGKGFVSTGGLGVSEGTASGKTTVCDMIIQQMHDQRVVLVNQDKPALFKSFFKWLKSGGQVLISDYCKKARPPSSKISEYISQRGYDLHDVPTYGQMLIDTGFEDVIAKDRTD